MLISSKGRYALQYMIDLAQNPGTPIPLGESAARLGISMKYLEQIAAGLVKEGHIVGIRGVNGGYRLNHGIDSYTALSIIQSVEKDFKTVSCLGHDQIICERAGQCPTLPLYKRIQEAIDTVLNSTTLADLAKSDKKVI